MQRRSPLSLFRNSMPGGDSPLYIPSPVRSALKKNPSSRSLPHSSPGFRRPVLSIPAAGLNRNAHAAIVVCSSPGFRYCHLDPYQAQQKRSRGHCCLQRGLHNQLRELQKVLPWRARLALIIVSQVRNPCSNPR